MFRPSRASDASTVEDLKDLRKSSNAPGGGVSICVACARGVHTLLLSVVDWRAEVEKRHCGREDMVVLGFCEFEQANEAINKALLYGVAVL